MLKAPYICCLVLLLAVIAVYFLNRSPAGAAPAAQPQKIVSLAPAITETLYALDLGQRVAGVTNFCKWPPQAAQKPVVGGFRDISLENIARSKADLVILPADMIHFKPSLEKLGIPVLIFNYNTLSGYLDSVVQLGELMNKSAQADQLVASFKNYDGNSAGKKPRILFVLLNPDEYADLPAELTAIGKDGFFSELMRRAGAENAYAGDIPYPRLSREALLALDPDILLISAPHMKNSKEFIDKLKSSSQMRAVRKAALLVLDDPGDTIPGPRALNLLRKIRNAMLARNKTEPAP